MKRILMALLLLILIFPSQATAENQEGDAGATLPVMTVQQYDYTYRGIRAQVSVELSGEYRDRENPFITYHILDQDRNAVAYDNERIPLAVKEDGSATADVAVDCLAYKDSMDKLIVQLDLGDEKTASWFPQTQETSGGFAAEIEVNCSDILEGNTVEISMLGVDKKADETDVQFLVKFNDLSYYNNKDIHLVYRTYDEQGNLIYFENGRYHVVLDEDGQAIVPVTISAEWLDSFENKEGLWFRADLMNWLTGVWFLDRKDVTTDFCTFSYKDIAPRWSGWERIAVGMGILVFAGIVFLRARKITDRKGRIVRMLPVAALFAFSFGAFFPGTIFSGNLGEFSLPFTSILPILAGGVLALFVCATAVVTLLPKKAADVAMTVVFCVSIAAYLQFNFLNANYGVLNGAAIDWSRFTKEGIVSACVWIACLAVPLLLLKTKRELVMKCMRYAGAFLTAVQVLALTMTGITAKPARETNFSTTYDGLFTVSKNENIIVFILDTWGGTEFSQWLDKNPEYIDKLQGFTFFDNAISGGASTPLGVPALLSGHYFQIGQTYEEYWESACDKTRLYDDLAAEGFDIRIGTFSRFLSTKVGQLMGNASFSKEVITSYTGFGKLLYRLALFNSAPQFMKQNFWLYSEQFSLYTELENSEEDIYKTGNSEFYQKMMEVGVSLQEENAFRVYHLDGCHMPYTTNERLETVPTEQTSYEQQMEGILMIVETFMDALKREGVYDDATIVITGDHGAFGLQANPAVLVKRSGESEGFQVSSAPIMFKELHATLADAFLEDSSEYGRTVFDVPEDEKEDRIHTVYWERMVTVYSKLPWVSPYGDYMFIFPDGTKDEALAEFVEHPEEIQGKELGRVTGD